MKLDNLNFDNIVVPKASSKRDKIDSLMLQGIINMINNAKAEGCYSVLAIQDEFVPKRVLQKLVETELTTTKMATLTICMDGIS
jgi:hypothetical protein